MTLFVTARYNQLKHAMPSVAGKAASISVIRAATSSMVATGVRATTADRSPMRPSVTAQRGRHHGGASAVKPSAAPAVSRQLLRSLACGRGAGDLVAEVVEAGV